MATVCQVVAPAEQLGIADAFQECCLSAWYLLIRVQSECLPLPKGCASEAECLSYPEHAAVFGGR